MCNFCSKFCLSWLHSSLIWYSVLYSCFMLFRVVVQSFLLKSPFSSPCIALDCGSLLLNTTVLRSDFHSALHVPSRAEWNLSSTSKEQGMVTQDPLRTSIDFSTLTSNFPHRAPGIWNTNREEDNRHWWGHVTALMPFITCTVIGLCGI